MSCLCFFKPNHNRLGWQVLAFKWLNPLKCHINSKSDVDYVISEVVVFVVSLGNLDFENRNTQIVEGEENAD